MTRAEVLKTGGVAKVTQASLEKVEEKSTKEDHNEIPFFIVHETLVKNKKIKKSACSLSLQNNT